MKSVSLSVFYPHVMLPMIPEFLIDTVLVEVADEFCRATRVITEERDCYVPANSTVLDIDVGSISVVRPFAVVSVEGLQSGDDWVQTGYNEVTLIKAEVENRTLAYTVATRPVSGAAKLDERLFEDWLRPISKGTLARLRMMPGQNFDPDLAAVNRQEYDMGVAEAKAHAIVGRNRSVLRTTPRPD